MGEKTTSVIDQEGYLGESNSAAIVSGYLLLLLLLLGRGEGGEKEKIGG